MLDVAERALWNGEQLAELRRWEEALRVLGPALASPQTSAEALLLQARCLLGLNQPKPAQKSARAALALQPDDARALIVWGYAELAGGSPGPALRRARAAARLDPYSAASHVLLVRCYLGIAAHTGGSSGNSRKARLAAAKALELDPHAPTSHLVAGLANAASGRRYRPQAEEHLRAGLALAPDDQDLLIARADLLRKQGRHREATDAYVAAGRLDPRDDRARIRLATITVSAAAVTTGSTVAGTMLGQRLMSGPMLHLGHGRLLLVGAFVSFAILATAVVMALVHRRRTKSLAPSTRVFLRREQIQARLTVLGLVAMLWLPIGVAIALNPGGVGLPRISALPILAVSATALWMCWRVRTKPLQ
jgi:tetratricopeptide (TPR) repeat protein